MANKSKAKGTRAETKVVRFCQDAGLEADRLALKGNKDCGDVWVSNGLIMHHLEVKAGKMTANYSRGDKNTWLEQTRKEGENSGKPAFLVIARHGKSVADYEVWSASGRTFYYLDEYVEALLPNK